MRRLFAIEKGVRMYAENSDTLYVDMLFGTGAPGGDSAEQDAAPVGSTYQRTNGSFYQKKTSTNSAADWFAVGDVSQLKFRPEKVIALTADAAPAFPFTIDLVANPFSDDEAPTLAAADFAVGQYVLFGYGGTPVIAKVTAVAAPDVTFGAPDYPLMENYTYIVDHFLPDSGNTQEDKALVTYDGSDLAKIADFNWALATGINLSGAFSPAGGVVAAGDTLEVAIAKIVDNQNDLITLSGVALGATDLGTFPNGEVIPDSSTIKAALAALDANAWVRTTATNVEDTAATLDEIVVDTYESAEWLLTLWLNSDKTRKVTQKIMAQHDGTASADAVTVDDESGPIIKQGASFTRLVSVDLNGTGAAQRMRLRIAGALGAGVSAKAIRIAN